MHNITHDVLTTNICSPNITNQTDKAQYIYIYVSTSNGRYTISIWHALHYISYRMCAVLHVTSVKMRAGDSTAALFKWSVKRLQQLYRHTLTQTHHLLFDHILCALLVRVWRWEARFASELVCYADFTIFFSTSERSSDPTWIQLILSIVKIRIDRVCKKCLPADLYIS